MQAADSILDIISSEISFVGSLYNEDHLLYDRLYQKLPAFTKGYLDAIIAAQQQVYGEFLIPGLLNDTILSDMQNPFHMRLMKTASKHRAIFMPTISLPGNWQN